MTVLTSSNPTQYRVSILGYSHRRQGIFPPSTVRITIDPNDASEGPVSFVPSMSLFVGFSVALPEIDTV